MNLKNTALSLFVLTLAGVPSAFAYSTATAIITCDQSGSESGACNTSGVHRVLIANAFENGFQSRAKNLADDICSELGGVKSISWEADRYTRETYRLVDQRF